MDNILIIRLISGEEVIANMSLSESSVTLKAPASIIIQAARDGRQSMGLADYLMFADNKDILFSYEPNADLRNAYNSAFGSGIVVAKTTGNIIPFTK
jgi:hypothetical protein